MTTKRQTVWDLCENRPPNCDDVADLYHWSTNYDAGKGPFTLFIDIIGFSEDRFGQALYDLSDPAIGHLEADKLGRALVQYADHPGEVLDFVEALVDAELDDGDES